MRIPPAIVLLFSTVLVTTPRWRRLVADDKHILSITDFAPFAVCLKWSSMPPQVVHFVFFFYFKKYFTIPTNDKTHCNALPRERINDSIINFLAFCCTQYLDCYQIRIDTNKITCSTSQRKQSPIPAESYRILTVSFFLFFCYPAANLSPGAALSGNLRYGHL